MDFGSFSTNDPSEFELALRPWDILLDSSGRANQRFEIEYFSLPGLTVFRETYDCGVRLAGMPPPDQLVLAIPIGSQCDTNVFGEAAIDRQLYSLTGEMLDARYGAGQGILGIQLDLTQEFESSLALPVEKLVSKRRNLAFAQSAEDVFRLEKTLSQLLQGAVNETAGHRQDQGETLKAAVEQALSNAILPEKQDAVSGRRSAQEASVTAALEYLQTAGADCTSVRELCAGAGVTERTLERGVRARFDCTVIQLLRKWRLHAARRRLLTAGPEEISVSQVATSFGFFDLGRFAATYRQLFDEYPSATLASTSRPGIACLAGM